MKKLLYLIGRTYNGQCLTTDDQKSAALAAAQTIQEIDELERLWQREETLYNWTLCAIGGVYICAVSAFAIWAIRDREQTPVKLAVSILLAAAFVHFMYGQLVAIAESFRRPGVKKDSTHSR